MRPFRFLADPGEIADAQGVAEAARHAEAIGIDVLVMPDHLVQAMAPIPLLTAITSAATEEKIGWVREAAGDRFESLELNVYPSMAPVTVTPDPRSAAAEVADRMLARAGVSISVDELLDSPHIFIGTVESLTEKLVALRQRLGISSIMVGSLGELDAVVERLAGT